jgi:hypothetical protein
MPSGPVPGSSGRQWLMPSVVGVVVVAVVVTLAVVLGGSSTPGRAAAGTDERTVAQTFTNLETARWNAGSPDNPPDPSVAEYGAVSCQADVTEMRKDSGKPPKPKPGPKLYSFAIKSITPSTKGRQLLTITRTTLADKTTGDGLFFLQQEGGKWKVCGLFNDTEPQDSDAAPSSGSQPPPSQGSEPPPSQGSAPPSGGSQSAAPPAGGGSADGGSEQQQVQAFANSFAQAVATGVFPLVQTAVCPDSPEVLPPLQKWTNAKAKVKVQSVKSGTAGGEALLQVSGQGLPTTNPTIVIVTQSQGLCIDVLAQ